MINWIEKSSTTKFSNADVSVRITPHHKNSDKKQAQFTFRNECAKRLTRTGYIMVGYDETRIYFAQALDASCGYKLMTGGKNLNSYLKVSGKDLIEFEGDYSLLKDAKTGLYFIQKEG
jgi:hypothetical protein